MIVPQVKSKNRKKEILIFGDTVNDKRKFQYKKIQF